MCIVYNFDFLIFDHSITICKCINILETIDDLENSYTILNLHDTWEK